MHIGPILVTGSILYTYWIHIVPIYCTHTGSILGPYWSLFIPRQGWGPLVLLLVETSRQHSQTAQSGRGPWSEMGVKLKTQTFQKRTRNESTWRHGEGKRQRARYEECKSTQPGHSAQGPAGNFSVGYFFHFFPSFFWFYLETFHMPFQALNLPRNFFKFLAYRFYISYHISALNFSIVLAHLAANRWEDGVVDVEAVRGQDKSPKTLKKDELIWGCGCFDCRDLIGCHIILCV